MDRCTIVADRHVLVAAAQIATNAWERARGMLGRTFGDALPALVLEPCGGVHTVGLRFPIDAVFYDRDRRVVRIVEGLCPLRATACSRARGVIETPSRTARSLGFVEGRRIEIEALEEDGNARRPSRLPIFYSRPRTPSGTCRTTRCRGPARRSRPTGEPESLRVAPGTRRDRSRLPGFNLPSVFRYACRRGRHRSA